ncbi:DUF4179 domain-containing protein [Cohnella luojiensis]|uniref:DUF4179 domain-containing protein n=1 Tax=Cohnella luojiensis TaxID=652876 RepID=A0A4Y8LP45_9BACL|nr:DUF4179 domain-containing protein [Cohnella luojiensis]TFE19423.1 DUF4179 domain-containing protein [Cohnella luojiensis]
MSNLISLEEKLDAAGLSRRDVLMPDNIDEYLRKGIVQGQARRKKSTTRIRRRAWSGIAMALLLIACVTTIRISPVFASFLREIPGMEAIVNLVRESNDRGIGLALNNDFFQPIGASDEYKGIKLTVEGIIADDTRAVIFYSVDNQSSNERLTLERPRLMDANGKDFARGISWGNIAPGIETKDIGFHRGTIDVQLQEGDELPETMVLTTALVAGETNVPVDLEATEPPESTPDPVVNHLYTVNIPVDRKKFEGLKQEYSLNQTITVEGQRITFTKATVYPLKIAVDVEVDESNSKQVFGPADIRMTDEEGGVWKTFMTFGDFRSKTTIYFESNYFRKPMELYLEGEWFRALDKSKMDIVIDTDKRKLLQAPDGFLKLKSVTPFGKYKKITLQLAAKEKTAGMWGYNVISGDFIDASGKAYKQAYIPGGTVVSTSSTGEKNEQEMYYYLDDKKYEQPLTFKVGSYPSFIHAPYKVRIK